MAAKNSSKPKPTEKSIGSIGIEMLCTEADALYKECIPTIYMAEGLISGARALNESALERTEDINHCIDAANEKLQALARRLELTLLTIRKVTGTEVGNG